MKSIRPLISISQRYVRKRAPPITSSGGILEEGTTFSDVHSVVLDPTRKLPYPEEHLKDYIEKTSKELLAEKRKAKYGNKKKSTGVIVFDHIPIEDQVVLLFPGQGAQFVGMGSKLLSCEPSKRVFEIANEVLGYDLLKMCLEGPKTKLDQTIYCQPAVFVSSIAAFEKLKAEDETVQENLTDVAGFSVGEFGALVAGGILTFEDALRIVKVRCEAMHECNQIIKSGMLTIRVKASSRLDDLLRDARLVAQERGEFEVCEVANYLFCGVRVLGASETCMNFIEEHQDEYDIKVLKRLAVSGAFHTRQMEGAIQKLRESLKSAEFNKAFCNVYSNYTGAIHAAKKSELKAAVVKQVTHPVKWEQIQQLLYRKHQDYRFPRYIEVGPGRQLGSMLLQTSKKAYARYEHYPC
ncbi:unnamed protein product [Auanema sp. JU1783]|nr:unnamed protein product [Auanema sp. JU1783]